MGRKFLIQRGQTYRVIESLKDTKVVGMRVRLKITNHQQEVEYGPDGFLRGLEALVLSGKFADSMVDLPPVKIRAVGSRNCSCSAYKFPHAPGFGRCKSSRHEESVPEGLTLDDIFNRRTGNAPGSDDK